LEQCVENLGPDIVKASAVAQVDGVASTPQACASVSAADVAQYGPPRQLVLTAGVRRLAEDSVADKGKYLGPACPVALCMTSLNDRQAFDSTRM
jgi:hypothetical protein